MAENYQKVLEKELARIHNFERRPRLLLHVCCAPCSSYVLEYLSQHFDITAYFYNPNISPKSEYDYRAQELMRLTQEMPLTPPVTCHIGEYAPGAFTDITKGLEDEPEGGARCTACYRLRLEETAKIAAAEGYDYFTTTLSISPLKNADKINEIGRELQQKYKVKHLPSDFKKRGGYLRSIVLSKEYGLYRQDYCGCVFSKAQREREKRIKSQKFS
jgi:predicted adenine nucleotide alpha hydrolase (AANH) superfamily ATPase